MMIEGIIPEYLKNWFAVVKNAIIDRTDACDQELICSFDDQDKSYQKCMQSDV